MKAYEFNQTIHFHDTVMKCSAKLVDWVELNKINDSSEVFLNYLGNYFDDDSTSVYALFGVDVYRFCVLINK